MKYTEEEIRKAVKEQYRRQIHESPGDERYANIFAKGVLAELTKPRIKPDRPVMYDYSERYGTRYGTGEDLVAYQNDMEGTNQTNIRPLVTIDEVLSAYCFGDSFELAHVSGLAMQKHLHALCYEEDE